MPCHEDLRGLPAAVARNEVHRFDRQFVHERGQHLDLRLRRHTLSLREFALLEFALLEFGIAERQKIRRHTASMRRQRPEDMPPLKAVQRQTMHEYRRLSLTSFDIG